jgi:acyl carrier protein
MKVESIETDIITFLVNNIVAPNTVITATTVLRDIGIDSFSIVEIILFIERKYGVVIPDDKLIPENFRTIQALSIIVNTLIK